jgi:hypothetical protein
MSKAQPARRAADVELTFICVSMPPWPGDAEATRFDGRKPRRFEPLSTRMEVDFV